MKLIKEETSGCGDARFVLHVRREEAELLAAVLQNAAQHTPRIPATTRPSDGSPKWCGSSSGR